MNFRQCLVGTTKGYMQLLDMRNAKCLKTFTTFTGSITDIQCDPFEPFIFTTSLDRFLRVHNLETKELLHKVRYWYLYYLWCCLRESESCDDCCQTDIFPYRLHFTISCNQYFADISETKFNQNIG